MTIASTVFVGARPNYPKAWTLLRALSGLAGSTTVRTVHTGQHSEHGMGADLAAEIGLRMDHVLPAVPNGSDGARLGMLLTAIDQELRANPPDLVFVIGDVNSSLAAAIAARRRGIPVVHLEAGLRSGDGNPEEVNRRAISALATFHLATTRQAGANLTAMGVPAEAMAFVGNPMAECFLRHAEQRAASSAPARYSGGADYVLLTMHKPRTLADPALPGAIATALAEQFGLVLFPAHPRTRSLLGDAAESPRIRCLDPQPYHDFGALVESARLVVTDSDGVHEECSVVGASCLVLLNSTARPETLSSRLATSPGLDPQDIASAAARLAHTARRVPHCPPEAWDVDVAKRIEEALFTYITR